MAEFKKIMTPKFRVAFATVWEPRAFDEGQEARYSLMMLFDETDPEIKAGVLAMKKIRGGSR